MTAEESLKKYPYYIYPAIEALADSEGEERTRLLRVIAEGVGPISALRTLIGADPEEFRDFYGDLEKPDLSTDDTISEFIGRFAPASPAAQSIKESAAEDEAEAEAPEPEEIPIAAPAVDYAATLLDNAEPLDMQDDDTADLLNSFLDGAHPAKPEKTEEEIPEPEEKEPEEPEKPAPVPVHAEEALAKIMVKNGNYRKALEIITELNLKNPKKSIYFADQMRFLRKLIQLQEKSGKAK